MIRAALRTLLALAGFVLLCQVSPTLAWLAGLPAALLLLALLGGFIEWLGGLRR